jgi:phosphoadenosine phosphosulfate reductase
VQQHGWPVDVLPVNNTMLGRKISGENGPLMQPYVSCCSTNIWFPLHYGVKALGVTKVIKGQRNSDEKKSTARNGSKVDGIEFVMPIQDWTESQVYQCCHRDTKKARKQEETAGTAPLIFLIMCNGLRTYHHSKRQRFCVG